MSFTERRREFKKGLDGEEQRRKRTESSVELRKSKRDEQLSKRRIRGDTPFAFGASDSQNADSENINPSNAFNTNDCKEEKMTLAQAVDALKNPDMNVVLKATRFIRRALSIEHSPPIDEVLKHGAVPLLTSMLGATDNDVLVFEAAWALTNISSGTTQHVRAVIDAGAVQAFVKLLRTVGMDNNVHDQVAWALGNIAGDNSQFRDFVLRQDAMVPLLQLCESRRLTLPRLRDAVWVVSNMCRGKPQPLFEQVKAAVPVLARLLHFNDPEVVTDACWAISYLSDDPTPNNEKIQTVLDSGLVPRMVQLLHCDNMNIKTPALRTIGNLVTGNDSQTQRVLDTGVVRDLVQMLSQTRKNIRKEVCWALSNITAGTSAQIQTVLDTEAVPFLLELMQNAEFEVKKEVAWIINNIAVGGTDAQFKSIVKPTLLPALSELLDANEVAVVTATLDTVAALLSLGDREKGRHGGLNMMAEELDKCGGVTKIDRLLHVNNIQIFNKAKDILDTYFDAEEENGGGCDELAPAVSGNGNATTFSFGSASSGSGSGNGNGAGSGSDSAFSIGFGGFGFGGDGGAAGSGLSASGGPAAAQQFSF